MSAAQWVTPLGEVFFALCKSVDTPKSLAAHLMYKYGEFAQLVQLRARPEDYDDTCPSRFRDDYLVCSYLSKHEALPTGFNTKQAALAGFAASESRNLQTNERLRGFYGHEHSCPWTRVISLAQQKIEALLGSHPRMNGFLAKARWGKGATFSLAGLEVRLDKKLVEQRISVTPRALKYLRAAMATDYHWLRARGIGDIEGPVSCTQTEFQLVRGSRLLTVKKNAKTDRTIMAEPSGNIFLQLGVGTYLRKCLLRIGIDLDDQSVNQGLAHAALGLDLATVDLSAASDSISWELVWLLLPLRWAEFLSDLRCAETRMPGKNGRWVPLQMFSSMGNGFTFELETLIFWSVTQAMTEIHLGVSQEQSMVSVYGDDIICHKAVYEPLVQLFEFLGFKINQEKSYATGPFRESCGKHYFAGCDVSPVYQKKAPSRPSEAYRLHNRLYYHAADRGHCTRGSYLLDRKLFGAISASERLVRSVVKGTVREQPLASPRNRTLDGALVVPFSRETEFIRPSAVTDRWWEADVLAFVPFKRPANHAALLAYSLRCVPETPFGGRVPARGQGRFLVQKRRFPEWCDGTWG